MSANPEILKSEKPRSWYRRPLWQLVILILVCFCLLLLWNFLESIRRIELLARIESNPNCTVRYQPPQWALDVWNTKWLPENLREWVLRKTWFPVTLELSSQINRQVDEDVLEAVARQSWTELSSLSYTDIQLMRGSHLLIPENCPQLRILELDNSQLNDVAVEKILERYPGLVLIKLTNQPFQGAGLSRIAQSKALHDLHLNGTRLQTLNFLTGCSGLKNLNLSQTTITDSMLTPLRNCTSLESLSLAYTQLTGQTLSALNNCQKLRKLELHSTGITDDGLKNLPLLQSLETLDLSKNRITGETLFAHGVPPDLNDLFLMNTQVQLKNLQKLQGHPKLGRIFLDQSSTIDDDCPWLGTLPSLYYLSLTNTNIGDRLMLSIATLKELSHLELQNTAITDACAPALSQFTSLYTLDISGTRISNDLIKALVNHKKLNLIAMEKTLVNDQAVPHLLKIASLNTITISQGQFNPDSIKKLRERGIRANFAEERALRK